MTGFKSGTGSLDLEEEPEQEETTEEKSSKEANDPKQEPEQVQTDDSELQVESDTKSTTSTSDSSTHSAEFDMANLPYLVQRQMRGASVNADRANQLLLEVRQFVRTNEDTFLSDLQNLVDGPVYKGDAREAAMIVAHENPELVAEKLREWGIDYLDT